MSAIVLLDQITKVLARLWLQQQGIVRILDGDFVWLVFVENQGLGFGLRILPPLPLAIISLVASMILGWYLYRYSAILPRSQGMPLALIMGGAVGNMIDRVLFRKVTDFVSVDMPDFIMGRWPVFNVADSAVTIGVIWMIAVTLFIREALPEDDTSQTDTDENPDEETL